MALITSAAAGNWSAGATWTGGVAPGTGDQAVINHAVAVDVNTTIGDDRPTQYQGTRPSVEATGTGGSLPAGNYLVRIAPANAVGPTSPTNLGSFSTALTAGQVLRVTLPALLDGSTSWHIYLTEAGGSTYKLYATNKLAGTFDCASASWMDGTTTFAAADAPVQGEAIKIGTAGTLTINDGVKLTCKGDTAKRGQVTINATTTIAGIEFDPTVSGARYRFYFGSPDGTDTTTLEMRGASASRAYVQTKTGVTPQAQIASMSQSSGVNPPVRLDGQWALFSKLGGSGYAAVDCNCNAAYNQLLSDTVFDADCYEVTISAVPATGGWIFNRVAFRQAQSNDYSGSSHCVSFQQANASSDATTGTRTVTDCAFEVLPPALNYGGSSYVRCYFHDGWRAVASGAGGSTTGDWTFTDCFTRKTLAGAAAISTDTLPWQGNWNGGSLYIDNVSGATTTDLNPHGVAATTRGVGTTRTIQNLHIEYNGSDDSGDIFKDATAAGTFRLLGNVIVPNAANKSSGTLMTMFSTTHADYRLEAEHNTYAGGPYSLSLSEGGAQPAGTVNSYRSNLVFNIAGSTTNRFAIGNTNGDGSLDTQDTLVPANTGYNAGWNLQDITGTFVGAYSWYATKLSADPTANDVDLGDSAGADIGLFGPKFVDPSRKFITWSTTVLGATGTDSAKITTGLNALKAIADTTSANHVPGLLMTDPATWVRAGFAPQNATLQNAGHDAVTIGAVEYQAGGTSGGARRRRLLCAGAA